MSHLFAPRHRAVPPPRRLLAIGGAGLITVLTVGGAVGLGPGAAMGGTDRQDQQAAEHESAAGAADDEAIDSSSDESAEESSPDDWLTIEEPAKAPSDKATDVALPAGSGTGKRVVFDMSDQRVWLVDASGRVARTYLVSGSLHDNLDPGTYAVYSKSRDAVSFDHRETMKYMVRFAHGDSAPIGFHDIPRYANGTLAQTRADLGAPQSAGCIRQWSNDAKALWAFTAVDTTVVVTA